MAERYHNGAFEPCAMKRYHVSKTIERTDTLPITINADGNELLDYRIYGASGGVGDDSGTAYGYVIPMSVSDGTTSTTTQIYVGSDLLEEIGKFADCVDYDVQKIIRKIIKIEITGDEYWQISAERKPYITVNNHIMSIWGTTATFSVCSHFAPSMKSEEVGTYHLGGLTEFSTSRWNGNVIFNSGMSITDFKTYLSTQKAAGTPVTLWYVCQMPIEEDPPVPLPALPTVDGTTIIDYDGTPKPSQMYIKYNSHRGWKPCTEYVRRNGVWVPQS